MSTLVGSLQLPMLVVMLLELRQPQAPITQLTTE
jgi:hypothetical protein